MSEVPFHSTRRRLLHRHAVAQHPMKGAVRLRERRRPRPLHLSQRLLSHIFRNGRVQLPDRLPEALHQHHFAKRIARRRWFTGCELWPVSDRIAQLPELFEGGVFDDGFVEAHELGGSSCQHF